MATQSIPLPPGAELVDPGSQKLPPGATLVSSGGLSPELRETSAFAAKHFAQSADSGAGASLKRTGSNLVHLPGAVIDAFTTPPQNAEEKSAMGMSGQGQFGLGLYRLVGHPMAQEHIKAQQLHAQSALQQNEGESGKQASINFWNGTEHRANMHDIASFVPVVGPIAAGITERYDSGDKSGALTDLATAVATPEAAKLVGKGARAVPGVVKAGAEAVAPAVSKVANVASDIVDPDLVGLVSPRLAHLQRLAGKVGKVANKFSPETGAAEGTAAGPVVSAPEPLKVTPADTSAFIKPLPGSKTPGRITLGTEGQAGDFKVSPVLQGGKPVGKMVFEVKGDTATVHWIGDEAMQNSLSNQLGPKGVKQLFANFVKAHPEVKTIEGIRIGGAQGEAAMSKTFDVSDLYGKYSGQSRANANQRQVQTGQSRPEVKMNPATAKPGQELPELEQQLRDSINQARAAKGLSPFEEPQIPNNAASGPGSMEDLLLRSLKAIRARSASAGR